MLLIIVMEAFPPDRDILMINYLVSLPTCVQLPKSAYGVRKDVETGILDGGQSPVDVIADFVRLFCKHAPSVIQRAEEDEGEL